MTTILPRPVCDLLGCTYPIVQAGMGGFARSDLGGGFGFLGTVREPATLIRSEVEALRERGQGWVARMPEALLKTIHADLAAMLASHESNFSSLSRCSCRQYRSGAPHER